MAWTAARRRVWRELWEGWALLAAVLTVPWLAVSDIAVAISPHHYTMRNVILVNLLVLLGAGCLACVGLSLRRGRLAQALLDAMIDEAKVSSPEEFQEHLVWLASRSWWQR